MVQPAGLGSRRGRVGAASFGGMIALSLLTTLGVLAGGGPANAAPKSLRANIGVVKLLDTGAGGSATIRLATDPTDKSLYYLKRAGDIYRVDTGTAIATLVYTDADHGMDNLQGFAIGPDGAMYLVNNEDAPGTTTRATIVKGVRQGGGARVWSTLARTVPYPRSATAYDHRFNGIAVSPDGRFIYVNSGSRTDHGEVQSAGGLYPGVREVDLTACVLRLPTTGKNIDLPNDRAVLKSKGYLFAEGTRNTFDLAFAPNGDLLGADNGPGRDDPEELNWLRPGRHYGFPWRLGGNDNPQQFPDYRPEDDLLLNPLSYAVINNHYQNDPSFPPRPARTLVEPIRNIGPQADKYRDPIKGWVGDASNNQVPFSTFTAHRSPLGLVFDRDLALVPQYRGDGFILSWTRGDPAGDQIAGPFKDASEDLLHLDLTKNGSIYTTRVTKIVGGFDHPLDAELIGNTIYVLEYGGEQSIWRVTMPRSPVRSP